MQSRCRWDKVGALEEIPGKICGLEPVMEGEMTRTRRWPIAIIAVSVLFMGAAVGAIFGERNIADEEQMLILRASRIVTALLEWLPEEKAPEDLVYDGIDGMLEVLDPHSNYLDPRT